MPGNDAPIKPPVRNEPQKQRSTSRGMWIAYAASACALVVALAAVLFSGASPSRSVANPAASGFHASAAVTSMLELSLLSASGKTTPEFHLTDQRGKPMTLAEFSGRAVVLTFNDDRCQDLCTLLAEDVIAADHDLGTNQDKIAFVSINANLYYPTVADVGAWTDSHGLRDVKNWYFGTGTAQQLDDIASAYQVPVTHNATEKTVEHGAEVFYIDARGREVGIGRFGDTSANTALYGHDLAQLAMSLLPAAERSAVGGTPDQPVKVSGALGSSPSSISVPLLGAHGSLSTAGDPNNYTVLNFWSNSCTACVAELPGLQKVHMMFGNAVGFLGVDVADSTASELRLVSATGIRYAIANDADGQVSGLFQIAELPFAVILDPAGKVVVRHPGLFTAEQLAYVLEGLDPSLQKLDTLKG
jgi:cytochrome oxidase Cu insertion factor (SCO1/SenC/PrrC family)/thiol-disulfide isomerase/thioredoxin